MNNITKEQREYIKVNFQNETLENIASELNLKTIEVAMEAKRLNLKKRTLKKFTNNDLEIIANHYKYLTYGQLGHVLNRNRTVIFNKIKELGLEKNDKDIILFKDAIEGYEDSIMFMHTNKNLSVAKIKAVLDKVDPSNNIDKEMINSLIFISEEDYKKKWKLFGKTI